MLSSAPIVVYARPIIRGTCVLEFAYPQKKLRLQILLVRLD